MRDRVTRLASYAILRNSGKILLCRLSETTTAPGHWTLPGGGIEFGESPEEAVIREVDEETGLRLHRLRLIAVLSETDLFQGKDYHLIRFLFEGEVDEGILRREIEGSTDLCEWVDEASLSTLPTVPLVRNALEIRPVA